VIPYLVTRRLEVRDSQSRGRHWGSAAGRTLATPVTIENRLRQN